MKPQNNEEQVIDAEALHAFRDVKKALKNLSKNQLILLVLQQMNIAVEQQNINKMLMEDLKKIGESNESTNSGSSDSATA